jgi:hypothetical protein
MSHEICSLSGNYAMYSANSGSSVCIAIDYGLGGPGIDSRWLRDFPPVQTGPWPTQLPVQWVTGLFRG